MILHSLALFQRHSEGILKYTSYTSNHTYIILASCALRTILLFQAHNYCIAGINFSHYTNTLS